MVDCACECRYATLEELRRLQRPGGHRRWLSLYEQQVYGQLPDRSRRETWLAGRILAKQLVADYAAIHRLDLPPPWRGRVEIDSGQPGKLSFVPRIRLGARLLPWSMSISHTQRGVLVALTSTPSVRVGVDLVEPAIYRDGFVRLWFTPAERRWLGHLGDDRWTSILWAAKEAAYKAINRGEPFRPRQIEILPDPTEQLRCPLVPQLTFRVVQTRQEETAVIAVWKRIWENRYDRPD